MYKVSTVICMKGLVCLVQAFTDKHTRTHHILPWLSMTCSPKISHRPAVIYARRLHFSLRQIGPYKIIMNAKPKKETHMRGTQAHFLQNEPVRVHTIIETHTHTQRERERERTQENKM
jgi:hypothetical protein